MSAGERTIHVFDRAEAELSRCRNFARIARRGIHALTQGTILDLDLDLDLDLELAKARKVALLAS
jgi:hypothetical protein